MKDPISVTKYPGYKILEDEHGTREASGDGLSGKILFIPGGISPCDFMKTAPLGRGFVHEEAGKSMRYKWRDENDIEHVCPVKDCCLAILQHAMAIAPITTEMSSINTGSKLEGFFSPKDKNGNVSIYALYLALLTAPEKPEYYREQLLEALNMHPENRFHFRDDWDENSSRYGSAYDHFLRIGEPWFILSLKNGGSSALKQAANLLEKLETKFRQLSRSEEDFLDAVSKSATAKFDVPTQKEVREIWLTMQAGRDEKQFRDVRDRLAFSWLPAAKRGKNTHKGIG